MKRDVKVTANAASDPEERKHQSSWPFGEASKCFLISELFPSYAATNEYRANPPFQVPLSAANLPHAHLHKELNKWQDMGAVNICITYNANPDPQVHPRQAMEGPRGCGNQEVDAAVKETCTEIRRRGLVS